MSSWFAWSLSVLIVVLALLYVSPKLRKTAFIWFTYISLTGWYYFRLWEKKRARNSSTTSANSSSSSSSTTRSGSSSKLNTTSTTSSSSSSGSGTTAPLSSSSYSRSSRAVRQSEADIDDVVYFEPADVALQQRELRNASERSARLSGSSSSGNSGYSDDSLAKLQNHHHHHHHQPKTHLGIFRSMRKSARESEKQRRDSEFSNPDPLARSSASEPGTTTRRTYTGRKKPQSWAD